MLLMKQMAGGKSKDPKKERIIYFVGGLVIGAVLGAVIVNNFLLGSCVGMVAGVLLWSRKSEQS